MIQPLWMPKEGTIGIVPAGRWWDAISVPQTPALDALQRLDTAPGRRPGPVIWEPYAARPRLYFLAPEGTAAKWDVPGSQALGRGCYIGVPGPTTVEPPGLHWLCPPHPDDPGALVDAAALRGALLDALAGGVA